MRVVSWADFRELAIDQEILDSLKLAHPEIPVCYESLEGSGIYREKVLTSIAAGTPPNVFLLDGIDIPGFINQGVLLDLTPYSARVGFDSAQYHARVMELFQRAGHVWAYPKGFTPMVIYYNKRLFDAAHIAYPRDGWTWDEFRASARRLTRDTDGDGKTDQWGLGWPREFFYVQSWIWAGGGDIFNAAGTRATGALDARATIDAVRFYLDLAVRDSVVPRIDMFRNNTGVPVLRLFYSNRLAMLQSGHWSGKVLTEHEAAGRLAYGVAPIPTKRGVAPVSVLYSSAWAVPKTATHRKWSVQVAAFLAGASAQRVRARMLLELPAMPSIGAAVAARDTTGREAEFMRIAATGRQSWGTRIENWPQVEDVLLDLLDRPLVRGEPVGAVAHDLAKRIDRIVAGPK